VLKNGVFLPSEIYKKIEKYCVEKWRPCFLVKFAKNRRRIVLKNGASFAIVKFA
jgi:hypothetical protein